MHSLEWCVCERVRKTQRERELQVSRRPPPRLGRCGEGARQQKKRRLKKQRPWTCYHGLTVACKEPRGTHRPGEGVGGALRGSGWGGSSGRGPYTPVRGPPRPRAHPERSAALPLSPLLPLLHGADLSWVVCSWGQGVSRETPPLLARG